MRRSGDADRVGGPVIYACTRGDTKQVLFHGDLQMQETQDRWREMMPGRVRLVYSDPPWNPGNATYWRTHAGLDPCASYDAFLDAWVGVVATAIERGAGDVLQEQSANVKHSDMLLLAVARQPRWTLPLLERWSVYYGSPGSASVRTPNVLFHFGLRPLATDPNGMAGEPMTIRACAGLGLRPGDWIVEACMGKGMTSRIAHYWQCNS